MSGDRGDRRSGVVKLVCLNVSLGRLDGGGQRLKAFVRALEAAGLVVELVGLGPHGGEADRASASKSLHHVKRRLLPVPLRRRAEAELAPPGGHGPTVCLVPSANRWALRSKPAWLDYSDLWSNIASNHAATVDPASALCNRVQSQLWSRREASEYAEANAVTVASWSDYLALGKKAVWLPHPVTESTDSLPTRRISSPQGSGFVYGLLGNFDYPPNRDAYDRLIGQWLSGLLPTARRIVVAGFGSEKLPRVANVDIIGPVDQVASFYNQIDVALAPVERGGGMKVKVVEAMMHGLPVVVTEHVKEGLPDAIVDELIDFNRLADRISEHGGRLRDPRENAAALGALDSFTYRTWERTIVKLWQERMVTP